MRYLGGKSKIRKQIAQKLNEYRKIGQSYFEPFVGGAWVLQEMRGNRFASDGNKSLITMYQELQKGWIPPDFVSEQEYKYYQKQKDTDDPMTAFIGFGCSFAGKWFGGYARSNDKVCYAATSKRSLMKQLPLIQDVKFEHRLYEDLNPINLLIYCDPPYADTTNYGYFDEFDNDKFWEIMRKWSENNTVIISEYKAPPDFKCIAEFQSQMGLTTANSDGDYIREKRIERLFKLKQ